MSTHRIAAVLAAGALLAVGSAMVGAGPAATAPDEPSTAFVVVASADGRGCDLERVDLATGGLTDLPAGTDAPTCVVDLAVAPDGTVYGTGFDDSDGGSRARLVTFDAAGSPSWSLITVPGATQVGMADGGIAVGPDGTIWVDLVAPGVCDTICLYALDAATGAASLVGPGSLGDLYAQGLSWCGPGLTTFVRPDPASVRMRWGTQSPTSGLVTVGAESNELLGGYDCATPSGALHAVTNAVGGPGPGHPPVPDGPPARVGTVDVASGTFTARAELSDPTAVVLAFAVAPQPLPAPEPAPASEASPAFTG